MAPSEPSRIIDQLVHAHTGDPWHGSPVVAVLKGVTAEQAAQRPPNGAHSIWELVLHMTGWRNEVAARITGKTAGEPEGGDYPAIGKPTTERWTAALEALDAAHRRLVDMTRGLSEEQLWRPTKDSRDRVRTPARDRAARRVSRGADRHPEEDSGILRLVSHPVG